MFLRLHPDPEGSACSSFLDLLYHYLRLNYRPSRLLKTAYARVSLVYTKAGIASIISVRAQFRRLRDNPAPAARVQTWHSREAMQAWASLAQALTWPFDATKTTLLENISTAPVP